MKSEDILQSDLLDVIFDNRNKQYGAYELRKHYKGRLLKSLALAFIFAGGLAALTSFIKEDKVLTAVFTIPDNDPAALPPVEKETEKVETPKKAETPVKAPVSKPAAQKKFTGDVMVVKDPLDADKINTITDADAIGGSNVEGVPSQVVVPAPEPNNGTGGDAAPAPKTDPATPLLTAEIMPAYPGGVAALRKFLEKNLRSFDELETGQVISVKITFIVGFDGKLKGFKVLEDGGDEYNREVIRVLKKMPEWVPGKANGENVSVYYTIPVKFTAAE